MGRAKLGFVVGQRIPRLACLALVGGASCQGAIELPPPTAKQQPTSAVTAAPPSAPTTPPLEGTAGPGPSPEATEILESLRARFGESTAGIPGDLPAGSAEGFRLVPGGLRPQFPSTERATARVLLPKTAGGAFHVEDVASGLGVDVAMPGTRQVNALVGDGYAVYPRAHRSGATLLHLAHPSGLEDYVSFKASPRRASVSYTFTPSGSVKGLRLVENTLELLDAGGAPRVRVAPPYIVGANGAHVDARLAIEGCAVDRDPSGPWGREVTAPGASHCTLRVSWRGDSVTYPAILDPRWTSTATTMTAHRQGHTATTLPSGKVLVTGGSDGTNALSSAELYDPTTKSWSVTGGFGGVRQLHTAVLLGTNSNSQTSGKVLIAGGWNAGTLASGAAVNTAQLYSPSAGTWIAATGLGTNQQRYLHTATVLANGQVLVAGGMSGTALSTTLDSALVFDPTSGTGTWTATTTMSSKAANHTATVLGSGPLANKVVVVGGHNSMATASVVQLFTPGANPNWTTAGINQLTTAREGHTATMLANGQVLVAGGKSGNTLISATFVLNPAQNPATWAAAGSLNGQRQGHTATLLSSSKLSNGSVLLVGGTSTTTNSAELWNGSTTWTATTPLASIVQSRATASLLGDGTVLIAAAPERPRSARRSSTIRPGRSLARIAASARRASA